MFSDASGTTPAIAGSTVAANLTGLKAGTVFSNSDAATTPDYITDANGRKCIKFNRASVDRLVNTAAAIVANITGDDNAYAVVMAAKRGPTDVSVTPMAFSRDDGGAVSDYIRHFFGGTDTVGITRALNGAGTNAASSAEAVPANNWYVVSWVFNGQILTIRVNGVTIASGVALNTAALTINKAVLGCFFANSTDTYDGPTAFDGAIGEFGITDAITSSNATLAQAEAYLMAKWTN